MARLTVWPDTTNAPPPADHPYASATWLLGRHPQLAALLDRVPGAVASSAEDPAVDLDVLARALRDHADVERAWAEYQRSHRPPIGDEAIDVWRAAGPASSEGAKAIGLMTGTEEVRLRLLATFAGVGATIRVADFARLDDPGRQLLRDWQTAIGIA